MSGHTVQRTVSNLRNANAKKSGGSSAPKSKGGSKPSGRK